jgi:hypothetical protein
MFVVSVVNVKHASDISEHVLFEIFFASIKYLRIKSGVPLESRVGIQIKSPSFLFNLKQN